MYLTAYDTMAGKKGLEADTVEKLSNYITLSSEEEGSQVAKTKRSDNGVSVYRLLSGSADIPAFSQPLYFESRNGTKSMVADIRPFITMKNARNQDYNVNNHLAYQSLMDRLVMSVMWVEHGPQRLLNLGLFPMRVFARLLTDTLARNLNVTQDTQYIIMILSCYYYYCLHDNTGDREYNTMVMAKVVALVHRVTGYELRNIHELLSGLPIIRELTGFVQILKDKTNSSRISNLNPAALFAMVGGSISGHDPRITIGVALEHPPTFIGLTYTTLNFKGAGRSRLGEIMKPIINSTEATQFKESFKALVAEFSK